jgi:hypothetical protein
LKLKKVPMQQDMVPGVPPLEVPDDPEFPAHNSAKVWPFGQFREEVPPLSRGHPPDEKNNAL